MSASTIGLRIPPTWPAVFITPPIRSGPRAADIDAGAPACAQHEIRRSRRDGDQDSGGDAIGCSRAGHHRQRRAQARDDADTSAAPAQAEAAAGPVGGEPSAQIGNHAENQRQARQHAQLHRREAARFLKIGGQPGDVEVEAVALCEVTEAEPDDVAIARQAKRSRRSGAGGSIRRGGLPQSSPTRPH